MNLIRLFLVIQNAALNSVWAFLFVAMVNIPLVLADSSTETNPFEIPEGVHTATFVEDIDGISVIKFSGNYDRDDSTGKTNAAARAVVAKEFYRSHSDDYDFLVVFSDFEFDTGSAVAFHLGVSNKVEGIGRPIYSNSAIFGSESELKGYIDMASIDRYETNSLNVNLGTGGDFSFTLKVLAHETLHQWGIVSGIDALQGRLDSHWSFFADTDASVQYGHDWRDNGDGTFTAEAARVRFSKLDLYLMGLAKKEEVPSFFVIEPAPGTEFSKGDLPKPGVTVSGTKQDFSVDDLIAVNGVRNPSFDESQKVFRYAFIYLTSTDDSSGSATVNSDLGKIRQVRSEYEDRFSVLTGGRGIARVYPAARFNTDAGVIEDVTSDGILDGLGDGNSGKAISWLLEQQNDDGSWSDRDSTRVRDSARVLQTFIRLGVELDAQVSAKEWFEILEPENADSLARQLLAVVEKSPQQGREIAEALQANQNSDGGWGLTQGLGSSVIDSGLALCSLSNQTQGVASDVLGEAFKFIADAQNLDGGWGVTNKSPSSVSTTARVLIALSCAEMQLDINKQDLALSWLLAQKKIDGGFGDQASSAHESAEVMLAFISVQRPEQLAIEELTTFIVSQQSSLGDWSGSVYQTALVIDALQSFSITNISVTNLDVLDENIYSGEIVKVVATVENNTALNTEPSIIEFSI
ncbi:MAG: terpene cyclase/mutase family protein, partial [Arenicella sp.]|nr:terpene cyclase/mutase family protein [Arenicella sp.]